MKTRFLIYLSCILFPIAIFAQSKGDMRYRTINVSTTVNYYPTIEPYSFVNSFFTNDSDLMLNFLTANSGTFVIEEDEPVQVDASLTNNLPSQLLGVGASIQLINENSSFHELSLTKLSFSKSSYLREYFFTDTLSQYVRILRLGYEQRSAAYAFRYEFGKYFGDPKRSSLRFGIAGAIEPSLYTYNRTVYSSSEFPISARLMTLDIALIPMVNAKVSKKVSMEFKVIPNILLADYGNVKQDNPILTSLQKNASRTYNLPEVNVAFRACWEIYELIFSQLGFWLGIESRIYRDK